MPAAPRVREWSGDPFQLRTVPCGSFTACRRGGAHGGAESNQGKRKKEKGKAGKIQNEKFKMKKSAPPFLQVSSFHSFFLFFRFLFPSPSSPIPLSESPIPLEDAVLASSFT